MSVPVNEFMTSMPHTIGHDLPIKRAKEMMRSYSCHHLPVLDGGRLVGILSDRDLMTAEKYDTEENIAVEDVMTEEPVVVDPKLDIFQVAMRMQKEKIGSVIVSATAENPWGIFTATDALRYFTEQGGNQ